MRRGYTLLELTLALAVMSLSLGVALPRLQALRDGWITEHAAQSIVLAHRRARIAAILLSRPLALIVSPDSLRLATTTDSVLWRAPGPASAGVVWSGPVRKVTFSPVGITMGVSNASFRLSRGAAVRTVVLSRLGRVRMVRGP